jgi:hypothetical protein
MRPIVGSGFEQAISRILYPAQSRDYAGGNHLSRMFFARNLLDVKQPGEPVHTTNRPAFVCFDSNLDSTWLHSRPEQFIEPIHHLPLHWTEPL